MRRDLPLAPGRTGVKRTSNLKRTRRKLSKADRAQASRFHASVQGRGCVVCGALWPIMEAHHGIEAQFLRREHLPVYDERNAVPTCGPCHAAHTQAQERIPRHCLPESVEVFAAEHGVGWLLDRVYGTTTESEAA